MLATLDGNMFVVQRITGNHVMAPDPATCMLQPQAPGGAFNCGCLISNAQAFQLRFRMARIRVAFLLRFLRGHNA